MLAEALLKQVNNDKTTKETNISIREIKSGVETGLEKINQYLDSASVKVEGDLLEHVSSISCNNDKELGKIISKAYEKVGNNGIVLMEESETGETYTNMVDGVQIESPLTSPHFVTDADKNIAVLDNPAVLIVSSPIPNLRKIQSILEHVIKKQLSLLIVAEVEQSAKSALLMNKVKGNIKVNIIDLPGFGPTKQDTIEDLALLTGATVINEELGDDLEIIQPDVLGKAYKSVTDGKNTVLTLLEKNANVEDRIKTVEKAIKKEKDPLLKRKLQDRIAMLSGSVAIINVGANSKIELKEKKDRVEDAIYATKAAYKKVLYQVVV